MAGERVTYEVPGVSCGHCVTAIQAEVKKVSGVTSVRVDLNQKSVTVDGEFEDSAVRTAIDEAGYEVAA